MTRHDLPSMTNLAFVEDVYEAYRRDPASVSASWRAYFASMDGDGPAAGARRPAFTPRSVFNPASPTPNGSGPVDLSRLVELQDRVDQLIRAYRVRGHLVARFDPLQLPRTQHPELEPEYYGLTPEDHERRFSSRTLAGSPDTLTLAEILERLRNTYCRYIGVQYMHIDDIEIKMWLQTRMESTQNRISLRREEQLRILRKLTDAVMFEEFIQKKYLGAKRFSLEGAESLIPLLDMAIHRAGEEGLAEIVFGMAHRGRLNVLANIIGKSPAQIFWEFEDADPERYLGGGDVKYHLGFSRVQKTFSGNDVHLSLCFNPSHLEFVNPVALGRMRAKQDAARLGGSGADGMVILIHGDAAFAGQGVIQETLNLSELDGYTTGGTLHVIVNNQIGFTTGPSEARSTIYASGVAKMLQIPIFHVNGEDPEAVAQVLRIAMDFRQRFHRDVVIDMYCYRRHGHNEGDEPAFTQPRMYEAIRARRPISETYLERLMRLGGVSKDEAREIVTERREMLDRELTVARSPEYSGTPDTLAGVWHTYRGGPEADAPDVDTGVPGETCAALLEEQAHVPDGFQLHPKLRRFLNARLAMASGQKHLDWANGEALALASLAAEGHRVRLAGQDSGRGTFSHRHAILHDQETGAPYVPLQHVASEQAPVDIINSPLSEVGVLGFEYGYSLDHPSGLVMWEAQFGDFCNVAQVIIDQFIISAEDKWNRLSGLVLLLPHGFEGNGPEHSSARLERFLTLTAEDNIQIVNPTTPAQYFHALRRQVVRTWRKPLVVMTPKSLLRHASAVSPLDDFTTGRFRRIIDDALPVDPTRARRVLLCSGKIYYELDAARLEFGHDDVAILRCEQLYPLADEVLGEALAPYPDTVPVVWVQEEPENAGAWCHLRARFGERLLGRWGFEGITREASASPATGSAASHRLEQERLIARAFATP